MTWNFKVYIDEIFSVRIIKARLFDGMNDFFSSADNIMTQKKEARLYYTEE